MKNEGYWNAQAQLIGDDDLESLLPGDPMEKIAHDSDRDFYLNAAQAVEYGLIDEVLQKPGEGEKKAEKK